MKKMKTISIQINQEDKKTIEDILLKLGVPIETAIDIFLKQIALTGGFPFKVTLPKKLIEDEIDLIAYKKAIEEYRKNPISFSHEEVIEMLKIEK